MNTKTGLALTIICVTLLTFMAYDWLFHALGGTMQ